MYGKQFYVTQPDIDQNYHRNRLKRTPFHPKGTAACYRVADIARPLPKGRSNPPVRQLRGLGIASLRSQCPRLFRGLTPDPCSLLFLRRGEVVDIHDGARGLVREDRLDLHPDLGLVQVDPFDHVDQ